jgi:hypothetical protein
MGSKVEKEKVVATALEDRGGVCVLCAKSAEDVEIHWHHLIMLFDRNAKPILDANGHIVFDRVASITTMVGQPRYSVDHVKAELTKCIPLCAPCHLERVHGHVPTADRASYPTGA